MKNERTEYHKKTYAECRQNNVEMGSHCLSCPAQNDCIDYFWRTKHDGMRKIIEKTMQ